MKSRIARLLTFAAVASLALGSFEPLLIGSSSGPPRSLKDVLSTAEVVFVGTIYDIDPPQALVAKGEAMVLPAVRVVKFRNAEFLKPKGRPAQAELRILQDPMFNEPLVVGQKVLWLIKKTDEADSELFDIVGGRSGFFVIQPDILDNGCGKQHCETAINRHGNDLVVPTGATPARMFPPNKLDEALHQQGVLAKRKQYVLAFANQRFVKGTAIPLELLKAMITHGSLMP